MRAIDTNVLIRFLTSDDPPQAKAARDIIAGGDIVIGVTVLLEAEWVLRAGYGFDAAAIASAFKSLGGLPGIKLEEPAKIAMALDWMNRGMDFADALHLSRASNFSAFVTFDKKLASLAKQLATTPVVLH